MAPHVLKRRKLSRGRYALLLDGQAAPPRVGGGEDLTSGYFGTERGLAEGQVVTPPVAAALFRLDNVSGAADEPFGNPQGDRPRQKERSNE